MRAHGYLIQQFLSPYTNRRTDEYGGSLENRLRFIQEIIAGIRRECGAGFPISVRLSVEEFYDRIGYPGQGILLGEGVEMAKRPEDFGIDVINVSSGNYDTEQTSCEPISFEPGWREYLAKAVKDVVNIPILTDPAWAKKAQEGRSEFIRELTHLAQQQGVDIRYRITADKKTIDEYQPYAVIIATGGEAAAPGIPGSDKASVVTVLAVGVRSCNALTKECDGCYERLYVIGDAERPGRIGDATRSAFELARSIL